MITGIEEAVAAMLMDALAENTDLAAVPYEVWASTSRNEVPGDKIVVAVRVAQGERTMGALIDPVAEILIATPGKNENVTIAQHKLMEQAVDAVFTAGATVDGDPVKDALSAAIETQVPGYTGAGFFNQGWQPGREDTGYVPFLSVKIGAMRE